MEGAIDEAYYGGPGEIVSEARARVDPGLVEVLDRFELAVK